MLATESGFNEIVYLTAAKEHMTHVNELLNEVAPNYVIISYLAGVSVECLFHAYRTRSKVMDTAKHNLRIHAEISGFHVGMATAERQRMGEELSEIYTRWRNNHRYRSRESLRAFVDKHKLYVIAGLSTTRQDSLKFNAERLVEAADRIITTGVRRWTL